MSEFEKISLKLKELECLKNALECVLTDELLKMEEPGLIELIETVLEFVENYIKKLEVRKKILEFEELEKKAEEIEKQKKSSEHIKEDL